MPETYQQTRARRGIRIPAHLVQLVLLGLAMLSLVGCARLREAGLGPESSADPAAAIREIAVEYAQSRDLPRARAALDALDLANPAQLVVGLADEAIAAEQPERDALARLAADLGASSPRLQAYLRPTPAPSNTPSPQPPTPTPQPTAAPTDTVEPTVAPTDTAAPPDAPTATLAPQTPRVVAESNVNLRGGPGRQYPTVGTLRAGQEAEIVGRNASGDWWQLDWGGGGQAWVAGTVVKIVGPIDTVAVARNIPAPPTAAPTAPRPTLQPVAAAPTMAPAPKAATPYVVRSVRVRPLGQDAQQCGGGEHNIFVQVIGPDGAPLDGVRVREVFTGLVHATGDKGPGRAEFDIYMNGGGQVEIVDEANNPISPQSRGMSANLPDWDLFLAAGYCNCKPYPDEESCRAGWEARDFRYMPNSHYVYEVVFQRTY